jgi:DNA-binding SARP family transcriptional activator/streptogramin lyase
VRFRVLGPLELENGAGGITLDAPKQRALLGVLLLHPNEAVSSERLIDELWGERPPATAPKVLQTYVSQLRRIVGADAILTRPPGYLLRVDEQALDATRFRGLVAEGRGLATRGNHEAASARYRDALALWRGPALAGVVFESFARNELERLEEERVGATIDLIDSELALGQHEEVVPELETLVRRHPLRERLRAQLMLALYRCGRQADALAAYQDARRALVDELGLEPGRELQELERAILTHDPALEAPARETPRPSLRRAAPWPALVAIALAAAALSVGLAFGLDRGSSSPKLRPNSVGFVDAESGRVTKSFPVGRGAKAVDVTDDSVWVSSFRDRTVTRIPRKGGSSVTIPVGGHPTGLVAAGPTIWVSTREGSLAPIDPRYDTVGKPLALGLPLTEVAAGGGFLWVTSPPTTVIRIDPSNPGDRRLIVPDEGARGPIVYEDAAAWVAGSLDVFAIPAESHVPGEAIPVGAVRDLTFGAGSLWVVSGGPGHIGGVKQRLRRVDLESRLIQTTIPVGSDPVAVAVAAASVWVASRSDWAIARVDPQQDRVVETLKLGSAPVALAADENGIWVATGA